MTITMVAGKEDSAGGGQVLKCLGLWNRKENPSVQGLAAIHSLLSLMVQDCSDLKTVFKFLSQQ